jgi:hypothetical protein
MSNSESEHDPGIGDDQLPEDLQPDEDNPLAEEVESDERVDDLLEAGKGPEQEQQPDDE